MKEVNVTTNESNNDKSHVVVKKIRMRNRRMFNFPALKPRLHNIHLVRRKEYNDIVFAVFNGNPVISSDLGNERDYLRGVENFIQVDNDTNELHIYELSIGNDDDLKLRFPDVEITYLKITDFLLNQSMYAHANAMYFYADRRISQVYDRFKSYDLTSIWFMMGSPKEEYIRFIVSTYEAMNKKDIL